MYLVINLLDIFLFHIRCGAEWRHIVLALKEVAV
jgi:hypothetical protein